jgi:DNA repair protein RadB
MEYKRNRISAGSYDLNKFLYGGYESDIITTIYGPPGTGKTNLCMLLSVSQAKKQKKVIFIDTEGGFSVERFRQIAPEKTEEYLKNIMLLKPTNFSEQIHVFYSLIKQIKEKSKIGAIIIDSMTMLYRLELAEAADKKEKEKIQSINKELAKQLRILAEISRKKQIPVIITNQVYSEFLTKQEFESGKIPEKSMVGGTILQYWSKTLIELKTVKGTRKLTLKKHRSLPEKSMSFEITNRTIRKKGWI